MRLLSYTILLGSLLLLPLARGTKAAVIEAFFFESAPMPDYDMSGADGLPTPFGFGSQTITGATSVTLHMSLRSVDPGTNIAGFALKFNTSNDINNLNSGGVQQSCDPSSIQVSPSPLAAGGITVSCNLTNPINVSSGNASFWYPLLIPGGTATFLRAQPGQYSLTFSDAAIGTPEPATMLLGASGFLVAAILRRFRTRRSDGI